jgi:hypothetical protein
MTRTATATVEGEALALWRHGRHAPLFFAGIFQGRLQETATLTGAHVWPTVAEYREYAERLPVEAQALLSVYRLGTLRLSGRLLYHESDRRWDDLEEEEGGPR